MRARPPRGSRRRPVAALLLMLLLTGTWSAEVRAEVGSELGAAASAVATTDAGTVPEPLRADVLGITQAVSSVLVEAATGQVLVAGDEGERRPIASAIKLVTALAVIDALPAGTMVRVGEEVRGVEGSSFGLRPGESHSVEDLLAGLLLRSGNDAARALAVAVDGSEERFVARMGRVLADLGIVATPGSASGLEATDALSALELATVAREALRQPRIRSIVGAPELVLADGSIVENRNLFLADTEGATGLKTGYTSLAGFTLAASARRDGRELVAVVLGAQDDLERRVIARRLLEHGFMDTRPVDVARSVTLRTPSGPVRFTTGSSLLTVTGGSEPEVAWPIRLRPDEVVASVAVLVDGRPVATLPVERLDGRGSTGAPSLGRALADGVYTALRPFALDGGVPAR